MALVEGQYATRPETVCQEHNGEIRQPYVEVRILRIVVQKDVVLDLVQTHYFEPAHGEISQESPSEEPSEPRAYEIICLGCHRGRHYERTRFSLKQVGEQTTAWLSRIGQRNQRRGVDD